MITTINNEHNKLNFSSEREQSQACLNSAEHEKNQGRKVLNVPNLRFPEFQGEWEKCKLGDLTAKVGSGSTPKGGNAVYTSAGHCFVRSQNVGMGYLILDDVAHINDGIHQKHKATELKEDDVLLNITGASIGRTAIATKEIEGGNVNQHVCIIRANSKVSPKFLCNYIQTKKIQNYIQSLQTGGSREGLNFEQIRSFPISLPNIAEQNKIAQLLDKLNERIATQNIVFWVAMRSSSKERKLPIFFCSSIFAKCSFTLLNPSCPILKCCAPAPIGIILLRANGLRNK